jgi:hypothetical protein
MVCLHELEQAQCSICTPVATRPRPVEVRAAQLERWIPALNESPVSAADLADVSGLNVSQIYEAVGFLRDAYPDLPLVSDGRGYRWSLDREDIDRYQAARAKTALTQVRRSWRGVVKPYLEEFGDTATTRLIAKQYERLLEDIEDMIA